MFELTVETEFAAAHAIVIRGERESLHGHNFRVRATVASAREGDNKRGTGRLEAACPGTREGVDGLDEDGLLCDFHVIERALREIIAPWHNRNLNEVEPFHRINPTAERIAEHIGLRLQAALRESMPAGTGSRAIRVTRVAVTEAPGCEATWIAEP